jgi:DNA repair protein RadC
MYLNVPINELLDITILMCNQNNIGKELSQEILNNYKTTGQQNYFQYNDLQYIQEGLAMKAPTSSIFSEIYLHYLKNIKSLDI